MGAPSVSVATTQRVTHPKYDPTADIRTITNSPGGVPSLEVTDIVVHTLSLDEVKGEKTDGSHKD